jgi:predicted transcriptional regulator
MPTRKNVPISEAESVVMQVFWERGALPTEEVVAALESHGKWQEATVKTLLNRLLKKGALKARKDNRRYVYSPVLAREDWLSNESHGFLDRSSCLHSRDGRCVPSRVRASPTRCGCWCRPCSSPPGCRRRRRCCT